MKIPVMIISFILLCVVEGIAGTPHQFQTGKLLDVGSDERAVEGTTIIPAVYQVQVGDLSISHEEKESAGTPVILPTVWS
jgi:hypothetical protein